MDFTVAKSFAQFLRVVSGVRWRECFQSMLTLEIGNSDVNVCSVASRDDEAALSLFIMRDSTTDVNVCSVASRDDEAALLLFIMPDSATHSRAMRLQYAMLCYAVLGCAMLL